jgi:SAM-dependent methyltransferase
MMAESKRFSMREAWDRASHIYVDRRGSDAHTVAYGNLAPGEDQLNLLGELRGKQVLDFGCGGGHNAVACAVQGATVTGTDLSSVQLDFARQLAQEHQVEVRWLQGDMTILANQARGAYDLILAIQVLAYLDDPVAFFPLARHCLRDRGQLVVSLDHPIRTCFYDGELDEWNAFPVRDYEDRSVVSWSFAPGLPMQTHHRPLGDWMQWLAAAGLRLRQLVEAPAPPELCDELWPEDSVLAPLRRIPHTAILVAEADP